MEQMTLGVRVVKVQIILPHLVQVPQYRIVVFLVEAEEEHRGMEELVVVEALEAGVLE
jgi:hypothetical protein